MAKAGTRVDFNHYNLEVFISIAQIYRQNLLLLQGLVSMDSTLDAAWKAAAKAGTQRPSRNNLAINDTYFDWKDTETGM
jgi:hypothetical protein